MDWSKAKTILIIAFIVTNLLLIYMLFENKQIVEPTISDDFIEEVVKLLDTKDISLKCEIPRELPSLTIMSVEYEKNNAADVNKYFFNDTCVGVSKDEEIVEFKKNNEIVNIINEKHLIYKSNSSTEEYNEISEEVAIQIAKDFLKEKGYSEDDMKLTSKHREKDNYYLEYTKIYNGIYLENTYTKFLIGKCGVKEFERLWLNPKELGENEIYISTAPKAILALLNMDSKYGRTIEDISLCYYFDPLVHKDVGDFKNTREGKAIPAWRVQFDDDSVVILDEY